MWENRDKGSTSRHGRSIFSIAAAAGQEAGPSNGAIHG
jgi:hypothetical protein